MYYIPSFYDDYDYPVNYETLRRQKAHEQARRQVMERQRRQEMLRRRLYEEERARREQEYYQRRLSEQERLRRARSQYHYPMHGKLRDEDEYAIVIGPGGYPYRVRRSDLEATENRPDKMTTSKPFVDASDVDFVESKVEIPCVRSRDKVTESPSSPSRVEVKKSKKKKKITVIVEDASDSENEQDSIWRNRHPSPGESWMEPIQGTVE